jgi:hypothetical protein
MSIPAQQMRQPHIESWDLGDQERQHHVREMGPWVAVEMGPGSDIDACYVQDAKGRVKTLSMGVPLHGPVDGPLLITTRGSSIVTTTSDYAKPTMLELVCHYRCPPTWVTKRDVRLLSRRDITVPADDSLVYSVPFYDRTCMTIMLWASAGTLDYQLYGMITGPDGNDRRDNLTGLLTTVGTTVVSERISGENIDRVEVYMGQNGGAATGHVISKASDFNLGFGA